jgi:hypothetical protein
LLRVLNEFPVRIWALVTLHVARILLVRRLAIANGTVPMMRLILLRRTVSRIVQERLAALRSAQIDASRDAEEHTTVTLSTRTCGMHAMPLRNVFMEISPVAAKESLLERGRPGVKKPRPIGNQSTVVLTLSM